MPSVVDSHRLFILYTEGTSDLYSLPRFSDEDRQLHFELSPTKRAAVEARTAAIDVHLVTGSKIRSSTARPPTCGATTWDQTNFS